MDLDEIWYRVSSDMYAPYGNRYKKFHPQRRAAGNPINRQKTGCVCMSAENLENRWVDLLCVGIHCGRVMYYFQVSPTTLSCRKTKNSSKTGVFGLISRTGGWKYGTGDLNMNE